MKESFLSRYTPSLMKPEDLEALFVQRESLARRIIELIHDSALTPSKHHTLLIGPRGIGKTHLVALIYYRIAVMNGLRRQLLIAWLREDEWGITSLLDLLLRVFRALRSEYGDAVPIERVESLYKFPADVAERNAAALLREFVGNRALLIIVENLEELFNGLGDEGQKRLRAYLQENPFCTILATAQSLFNGISLQTSPFYGFFRIHHLEELTLDDAIHLLARIANFEGDRELASLIQAPMGRARIRAVHHLAAGNHRVYVIFSQFLSRESLDELVPPLIRTLDDLTPYYQVRMAWLSPQQRKVIEFLCDRRHAVPVKEIAQRCFMTHQVTSGQLKELRQKGYVHSTPVGRESYYELREPLMRLCIEVKKHRAEPIRLLVDFLRLWYSQRELERKLEDLQAGAPLEREYLLHALRTADDEKTDCLETACLKDYDAYIEAGDFGHALEVTEELVAISGSATDWLKQGVCLAHLERLDEALMAFDKAIELKPEDSHVWLHRGMALDQLRRYDEALMAFDKAIELKAEDWSAWYNKGFALGTLGRHEEALAAFDKAIELNPREWRAWSSRGRALNILGRWKESLAACDKALELNPKDSFGWFGRGMALGTLGRHEEALAAFDKALELNPKNGHMWGHRGEVLGDLGHYEEALAAFDKALELNPKDLWVSNLRGVALGTLGRHEEALAAFDKAIELNPKGSWAWALRGAGFKSLDRYDEALAAFDKAIEFGEKALWVFFYRAEAHLALNHWKEASMTLDSALSRSAHHDEVLFYTGAIVRALLATVQNVTIWRARLKTILDLYDNHGVLSALGQGLVRNIPVMTSQMVSDMKAQEWLEVWQELAGNRKEFETPLRLLSVAVRYRQAQDQRVLLELPLEERKLLEPLLGVGESLSPGADPAPSPKA